MLKYCNDCKTLKETEEFASNKTSKDGFQAYCRICHRKRMAEYYLSLRHAVLDAYGWECQCCGEDRYEFLAIDHETALKISREDGGTRLYQRLKREGYPEGFRTLCHNCNCSRGYYGYCPHEVE